MVTTYWREYPPDHPDRETQPQQHHLLPWLQDQEEETHDRSPPPTIIIIIIIIISSLSSAAAAAAAARTTLFLLLSIVPDCCAARDEWPAGDRGCPDHGSRVTVSLEQRWSHRGEQTPFAHGGKYNAKAGGNNV